MEILNKRKKWTNDEINIMKSFIKQNEEMLLTVFYKNISIGKNYYKKEDGFFREMGDLLKRRSSECKSKFQKFEEIIYCDFLSIPKTHYKIYLHCRKTKKIKKNKKKFLTDDLLEIKKKISNMIKRTEFKIKDLKMINLISQKVHVVKMQKQKKIALPSLKNKVDFLENQKENIPSIESFERSIFSLVQEKNKMKFLNNQSEKAFNNKSFIFSKPILIKQKSLKDLNLEYEETPKLSNQNNLIKIFNYHKSLIFDLNEIINED